jgi:hypothetical protein
VVAEQVAGVVRDDEAAVAAVVPGDAGVSAVSGARPVVVDNSGRDG